MVNLGAITPIIIDSDYNSFVIEQVGVAPGSAAEILQLDWAESGYHEFTVGVWKYRPQHSGYLHFAVGVNSSPVNHCGLAMLQSPVGDTIFSLSELDWATAAPTWATGRGSNDEVELEEGNGVPVDPDYIYWFIGVSDNSGAILAGQIKSVASDNSIGAILPPVIPPGTPDEPPPDPDLTEPPPIPWDGIGDYPDPYEPGAVVPPRGHGQADDSRSANLLDLIREFSAATKRAVRLTGPAQISIVDPAAALPTGWSNADAEQLYTQLEWRTLAGAPVLNTGSGHLSLDGSATLVTDDVRLLTSSWSLPDKLPVWELQPARVKRVTHTFTPKRYTGSVEFSFPAVPLGVRR